MSEHSVPPLKEITSLGVCPVRKKKNKYEPSPIFLYNFILGMDRYADFLLLKIHLKKTLFKFKDSLYHKFVHADENYYLAISTRKN